MQGIDVPKYKTIEYSMRGDAAHVTLNRPDVLNSLNTSMRHELADAFLRAPAEGARAVLLNANGAGFCAGQDLGEASIGNDVDVERTLREEYEPMIHAITDCEVPVVCAVNGVAAGAGLSLAILCDLVIAARSASFVCAFGRIGLVPDVGLTYMLPRLVGLPRAMGMAMTTQPVTADQAEAWGLIWRAVDDEQLAAEAEGLAAALAKAPTRALSLTKHAMRDSLDHDFVKQLRVEATSQARAAGTRDFAEGRMAFVEKRPAIFEGR